MSENLLTFKIIITMTKKELNEIIDFLTEECANKIAYDLDDIAFTPYMAREEDWEGTLNPASVEVYNYYERVRSYFINQLLAKDKKELTEEEYQQILDEYELKFVEAFGRKLEIKFLFEGDNKEENLKTEKELKEQIDILTEECIKKIVDEIGCADFVTIMLSDEDYGYEESLEYDYEKDPLNSPLYKQAKEVYEEYKDKRYPLIEQLVEVRFDNGCDCDEVEVECEYEFDFVYKFGEYINTTK